MSRTELYKAASDLLIWAIQQKLPFDVIADHPQITAAVKLGFDLHTIKEAWM